MLCVRCLAAGDITETQLSVSPSLPRAGPWSHTGKPPALIGRDLEGYAKSGRLGLYTHSEQHVRSCSAHRESAREKLYLLKLLEALAGFDSPDRETVLLGRWSTGRTAPGLSAAVWGPHRDLKEELTRNSAGSLCSHTQAAAVPTKKPE